MTARPTADPRPANWVLRLPGGRRIRMHRRSTVVALVLAVAALAAAGTMVFTGAYRLAPDQVVEILLGGGDSTGRYLVLQQRLPRALAALAVGAALGLSGCIFQSVSRNPLGSPDIVGFTTGAASGGLVVILLASVSSTRLIVLGTIAGGLLTAAVVLALSAPRRLAGERLILVGIAIGAMLASVNDYLLTEADIQAAETAKAWQFGSLNLVTWGQVWPALAVIGLLLIPVFMLTPTLHMLELGDDTAASLGVPLGRRRLALMVVAVALAAVGVATAGPIGFLALAGPQLAARLARSPGAAVVPSMMMGAVLLVVGDLLAQRLLSPFQIPVGLVTAALGGAYLLWLLSAGSARTR